MYEMYENTTIVLTGISIAEQLLLDTKTFTFL